MATNVEVTVSEEPDLLSDFPSETKVSPPTAVASEPVEPVRKQRPPDAQWDEVLEPLRRLEEECRQAALGASAVQKRVEMAFERLTQLEKRADALRTSIRAKYRKRGRVHFSGWDPRRMHPTPFSPWILARAAATPFDGSPALVQVLCVVCLASVGAAAILLRPADRIAPRTDVTSVRATDSHDKRLGDIVLHAVDQTRSSAPSPTSLTFTRPNARSPRPARQKTQLAGRSRYVGTLSVESVPAGAVVTVNGRKVGMTPMSIPNLPAGSHVVWVNRDGYKRWTTAATVAASKVTSVNARLEP